MAGLTKLRLKPGVSTELTPTLNEASFSLSQLIRFFAGLPQKLGGWSAYTTEALTGTCRGMFGWADQLGNAYVACGTEQRLTLINGGSLNDITPVAATTNPSPAFVTEVGSTAVTVTDSARSPSETDFVSFLVPISIGGLMLSGTYQVASITDGSHYTITVPTPAPASESGGAVPIYATQAGNSTITVTLANHGFQTGSIFDAQVSTTVAGLTIAGIYSVLSVPDSAHFTFAASGTANATTSASENSGNARLAYLLPTGVAVNTVTTGFGIGDYGLGDWGRGATGQGDVTPLRSWSMDHFGQDLIASPRNGGIYYWEPPTIAPAQIVSSSAPMANISVLVMSQVEMIIALGAEAGGTQFPTLIRWSDVADFTDWVASATNQAGSFQLSSGSACVAGLAIGLGVLIWTDTDLWRADYVGLPFVLSFNRIGTSCETISARAPAALGAQVIWPSLRQFHVYSGGSGVAPIECPVWDFFYDNLDYTQLDQVFAAMNSVFSEVAWHFPFSDGAGYGYVKYNVLLGTWDFGPLNTLPRTAWIDQSPAGQPMGADLDGILQQHEIGNDANGAPMVSYVQSGFFDMQDGDDYVLVDLIIPDFVASPGAQIEITVFTQEYSNGQQLTYGPFIVTPSTTYVNFRARGRQMAIRIGSSDLGSAWRLGALRYRFVPDGKR